jgi:hypothetical protein
MMPPNTSPRDFRPGRFRLPPGFKLWPDMSQALDIGPPLTQVTLPSTSRMWPDQFPALLAPAFPETPPIPPTVAAGDLITAVHENTVTEGINDLWIDLQWLAANAAVNPTTTKGDLIVNDGGVLARVPVGTDAQVLTADSTLPLGIKWATATAPAAVSSVFNRTGAVVAVAGDYTAAMVTNAVSTLGSYADPAWISSLSWAKITGAPATFPPATHTHDAAAIVSGVISTARLGTGTANAGVFLRGDGTWAAVGTGTSQTPWTSDIDAAGFALTKTSKVSFTSGGVSVGQLITGGIGQIRLEADVGKSLVVTGDPLTMSSRSDDLIFRTTATERARITAAGLVGIGRVPTTYPLEVAGDVNVTGAYRVNGVPIGTGGGNQTPWTSDIKGAQFGLWDVRYISIGQAILQNAPSVGLSMIGNGGLTSVNVVEQTATGACGLTLNNDASHQARVYLYGSGVGGAPNALVLATVDPFPISFQTSNTERMRITGAGSVGIGVAAPGAPLEILGGTAGADAPAAGIILARYHGSDYRASAIYDWYDSASTFERLAFAVSASANPYGAPAVMTLDQAGNVGIGTGSGAIGNRVIILPAANPSTVAAANTLAIGEASNNGSYRLNFGYAVVLNGNNWAGVIQSNVGGATGAICINPAGGQVLVGTSSNPLNFGMTVSSQLAVTQAANLYLTLGLDPGGYAGSGVTGSGMWYDTTNNCMRLESLTGGVAWRGVTTCVNGGYFGIGIVAPQFLLSLGAGAQTRKLAIYDNAGDFIGFGLAQATLRYDAGASAAHVWYTGSQVERMRITSAGLVGIAGTPGCNLDVAGWIRATAIGTPPSAGKGVNIFYHGPNDSGSIHAYDYTLGVYKKLTVDGAPLQLCGSFGAGNVAIGTLTPAYKLDVLGDVNCSGAFRVNGVPKLAQLEAALSEISVRLSKLEGAKNQ